MTGMPDAGSLAIVAAGAALAGFAQGLSGFAFAMIALSVWAWALAPQVAAPLAVFGALLGQLLSLMTLRRGFEFGKILPFVIGGVIGVPIGVFALHNIDIVRFKLMLGTLLTLYSLYGLFAQGDPRVKRGGSWLDAFVGVIGGVLGGLGGMSGSIPAVWTQLRGWKRDLRRATMQVYNTAMHVLTLTVYWRTGALAPMPWILFAVAAPAMLIPAIAGARMAGQFSERVFNRVVLLMLLASGLALLYGFGRALWR